MDLELQKYLRSGKTLQDLTAEFAIHTYFHPELSLVGFKYDQIDSQKTHPLVRECRGIVLEKDTWKLVAKPFNRFFNAGENADEFAQFNWHDFTTYEKVDGSLAIVFYYAGRWHMNTSGSFAQQNIQFQEFSWSELFWQTATKGAAKVPYPEFTDKLNPSLTYVFELCTIYNKIVRLYPEPTVFLLSVFETQTRNELKDSDNDDIAKTLAVARPNSYQMTSFDQVTDFLFTKQREDPTYEGVVIRDDKNIRFKCKTETYLSIHHMFENGNIFNPSRLVPLVLGGEDSEVLAVISKTHPEIEPHIQKVKETLKEEWENLLALWQANRAIESQKDFALAIVKKTPFSGLLFANRKHNGDESMLLGMWRKNSESIVKNLF